MSKINKKKWQELNIGAKINKPGSSINYQTGTWRNQIPVLNKKDCDQCGDCIAFCPEDCIIVKDNKISHIDYKFCKGCGICAKECPKKSFTMKEMK